MDFSTFKASELMKKPAFKVEQNYFDWEMAITKYGTAMPFVVFAGGRDGELDAPATPSTLNRGHQGIDKLSLDKSGIPKADSRWPHTRLP